MVGNLANREILIPVNVPLVQNLFPNKQAEADSFGSFIFN